MALISITLIVMASLLTILGQTAKYENIENITTLTIIFSRSHFFMVASSIFTLAGLSLGSSMIMLVSTVSEEFNTVADSQVSL